MTRLDCAIELLGLLCMAVSKNEINIMDKVEAVARAIMELGRSEGTGAK
jgi:hypothetical protein